MALLSVYNAVLASQGDSWNVGEPIVSYWAGPMPITDKDARIMKDGGWNLVWVTQRGKPVNQSITSYYLEQLDRLTRYDLRGIVTMNGVINRKDKVINEEKLNEFGLIINEIRQHPALYAYHIIDEPSAGLFDVLIAVKEYILERDESHLLYVNLYPIYAKLEKFGVGDVEGAYRKYLERYAESFDPQIFSFDHYAFNVLSEGDSYFQNLSEMRSVANKFNRPFMAILQASSWSIKKRVPTAEELRWQVYTSLAYGAQGISWYVYGYPGHDGGMVRPIANDEQGKALTARGIKGGEVTPLYSYVRKLNREFTSIAKQLQGVQSTAVFGFSDDYKDIPALSRTQASFQVTSVGVGLRIADYLVGEFAGNGTRYGLIVNLDNNSSGYDMTGYKISVNSDIFSEDCIEKFVVNDNSWEYVDVGFFALKLPPGDGLLVRSCLE